MLSQQTKIKMKYYDAATEISRNIKSIIIKNVFEETPLPHQIYIILRRPFH